MSMSHKAFVFDWQAFLGELAPLIVVSLTDDDPTRLIEFGNAHLSSLKDPYEGEPLTSDWTDQLKLGIVQETADYVLTRFYKPREDAGIGEVWLKVEGSMTRQQRVALLGQPFGPATNLFDPGKMGSYFQDEVMARRTLALLDPIDRQELRPYLSLLRKAVQSRKGIYVTFRTVNGILNSNGRSQPRHEYTGSSNRS